MTVTPVMSPCLNCQKRTINCHNPKTCEPWGEYRVAIEKEKKERASRADIKAYYIALNRRIEKSERKKRKE